MTTTVAKSVGAASVKSDEMGGANSTTQPSSSLCKGEDSFHRGESCEEVAGTSRRKWTSIHDQYQTLEVLGQGTYGVVYKAEHKKTKQIVGLKRCRLDTFKDFGIPETTLREVSLLRDLRHENIMSLYHISCDTLRLYMVCEYLDQDLRKFIRSHRDGIPLITIKHITFSILQGLAFCHGHRIMHRDLKPHNILLSKDASRVKIADFGLARSCLIPGKTLTHEVVTLWYRAPELLLGDCNYSTIVDMWSVGCIVAEMLHQAPLFAGDCEIDTLFRICRLLGTPHKQCWPKNAVVKWEDFPQLVGTPNPFSHISNELDISGQHFLKSLLQFSADLRITALQALNHPWLKEIRDMKHLLSSSFYPEYLEWKKEFTLNNMSFFQNLDPTKLNSESNGVLTQSSSTLRSLASVSQSSTTSLSEHSGRRDMPYESHLDAEFEMPFSHRPVLVQCPLTEHLVDTKKQKSFSSHERELPCLLSTYLNYSAELRYSFNNHSGNTDDISSVNTHKDSIQVDCSSAKDEKVPTFLCHTLDESHEAVSCQCKTCDMTAARPTLLKRSYYEKGPLLASFLNSSYEFTKSNTIQYNKCPGHLNISNALDHPDPDSTIFAHPTVPSEGNQMLYNLSDRPLDCTQRSSSHLNGSLLHSSRSRTYSCKPDGAAWQPPRPHGEALEIVCRTTRKREGYSGSNALPLQHSDYTVFRHETSAEPRGATRGSTLTYAEGVEDTGAYSSFHRACKHHLDKNVEEKDLKEVQGLPSSPLSTRKTSEQPWFAPRTLGQTFQSHLSALGASQPPVSGSGPSEQEILGSDYRKMHRKNSDGLIKATSISQPYYFVSTQPANRIEVYSLPPHDIVDRVLFTETYKPNRSPGLMNKEASSMFGYKVMPLSKSGMKPNLHSKSTSSTLTSLNGPTVAPPTESKHQPNEAREKIDQLKRLASDDPRFSQTNPSTLCHHPTLHAASLHSIENIPTKAFFCANQTIKNGKPVSNFMFLKKAVKHRVAYSVMNHSSNQSKPIPVVHDPFSQPSQTEHQLLMLSSASHKSANVHPLPQKYKGDLHETLQRDTVGVLGYMENSYVPQNTASYLFSNCFTDIHPSQNMCNETTQTSGQPQNHKQFMCPSKTANLYESAARQHF